LLVARFDTVRMQLYHPRRLGQRKNPPTPPQRDTLPAGGAARRLTVQPIRLILLCLAAAIGLAACEREAAPSAASPTAERPITVASLVPAASQLVLAMGAGDQLVATSNYDVDPEAAHLPRVGDYQTADWERL